MTWLLSYRADRRALPLADRHYNRQAPGSPQFVPPGRCVVLLDRDAESLWVTSWPFAQHVKHAWPGAWVSALYRREAGEVASVAIRAAVAATRFVFGDPPTIGMVTFIDPAEVPGYFRRTKTGRVLEWGYSYRKAGFVDAEPRWTKGGLVALQLWPDAMPAPHAPRDTQCALELTA